jgi:hypothetical protein
VDTLKTWHANRLVIHAIDNATAHNRDSLAMVLDYNLLPTAIVSTTPADAAVNVENAGFKFVWTGGDDADGDPVSYIVRYGADPLNLAYSGFATAKEYTPAPALKGNTQYFWTVRVCAGKDSMMNPPAGTWSFTTRNHPTTFSLRMPDDTLSINDTIWLRVHATDAEGIKKFQWTFNGAGLQETTVDSIRYISPATAGQATVIVAVVDSFDQTTSDTATLRTTDLTPTVFIGNDTTVGLHDSVQLRPRITDDGKIVKYEWGLSQWGQFSPDSFKVRSKADTLVFSPSAVFTDTLMCVLRATDEDQHVKSDTIKITSEMKWNLVSSGKIPVIVGGSVLVYNDTIWLLGGSPFGASMNDSIYYSKDGINWKSEKMKAPFSPRVDQSATIYNNKMWVISGVGPSDASDAWYSVDARSWIQACNIGTIVDPSPSTALSYTISGFNFLFLLNARVFWSDGNTWEQAAQFAHISPYHASAVFHDTIWVFGGIDNAGEINFSTDGALWQRLENSNFMDFSAQYAKALNYNGIVWVHCGPYGYLIFSLNAKDWTQVNVPFRFDYSDSYCFVKDGKMWAISNSDVFNTNDNP